jgi:hypothetical protein
MSLIFFDFVLPDRFNETVSMKTICFLKATYLWKSPLPSFHSFRKLLETYEEVCERINPNNIQELSNWLPAAFGKLCDSTCVLLNLNKLEMGLTHMRLAVKLS